ncbi:MAG: hypothetical protein J6M43_02240 [Neisseriaceae bacterium]|nr:hypothetical protein [Neisseriaceae bacterium]
MKWVFAILVALNLIVFTTTIIRQMVVAPVQAQLQQNQQQQAQAPQDRTIVIQTPPPQLTMPNPPVANNNPAPAKAKAPKADNNNNKKSELITDNKPKAEQSAPKNCGGATVTLKEDDYHRIKGLLSKWPNAASQSVAPKANTNERKGTFWVALAKTPTEDEKISLMAKSYRPVSEGGYTVVGKFTTRLAAEGFRLKLDADGFSTQVVEQLSGNSEATSVAMVTVAFLKVDDNDAAQISEIVKPYAKLKRNSCKS